MTETTTETKWQPPTPGVHERVWYYQGGQTNREPRGADVIGGNKGVLSLRVWDGSKTRPELKQGVRHKDDPWHQAHPKASRANGVWGEMPNGASVEADPDAVAQAVIKSFGGPRGFLRDLAHELHLLTDDELRVLELFDEMGSEASSTEIAKRMTEETGREWKYQKVNVLLARYKRVPLKDD